MSTTRADYLARARALRDSWEGYDFVSLEAFSRYLRYCRIARVDPETLEPKAVAR